MGMSLDAAVSVLTRAVELDQAQSYSEALVCYQEGLTLLMNVLKDTTDDTQKVHYRAKMESYIERAEKLKKLVREQQEAGTFHEKINIKEESTGYSYRRVFEKYLEGNVQEVVVEDPYIRNIHQIYNFLRFCELLVRKGTVRNVKLLTTQDEDPESQNNQVKRLQGLKTSLKKHNINLEIGFSQTLHDREIRFNNGWVIKIGRGLDYFKPPPGKFCVGFCDFDLRECHETVIDIYLKKA
ncbi:MIT domain-containing protein 1-like [Stylophora pistillata]|uniref:MIT domain-containing protein 1 n=1 Tax=Stylophora pistillata TaxID=50429 RepID=A0A2B4SLL4_STYPI|nr:MIT domain-containing protein 1-like [Stylophora pistillata]PFX30256.1 MIT domain-containing protein 1 [Stylophora pistillata]